MTKFVNDFKSNHRVKDALNTKGVIRNLSEEQIARESGGISDAVRKLYNP